MYSSLSSNLKDNGFGPYVFIDVHKLCCCCSIVNCIAVFTGECSLAPRSISLIKAHLPHPNYYCRGNKTTVCSVCSLFARGIYVLLSLLSQLLHATLVHKFSFLQLLLWNKMSLPKLSPYFSSRGRGAEREMMLARKQNQEAQMRQKWVDHSKYLKTWGTLAERQNVWTSSQSYDDRYIHMHHTVQVHV